MTRTTVAIGVVVIAAVAISVGCGHGNEQPARSPTGENTLEVMVMQDGKPVTDATVSTDFYMAAMPSMNMPEMRTKTDLTHVGNGTYRGKGQVTMAGNWDVTVVVMRGGQTDRQQEGDPHCQVGRILLDPGERLMTKGKRHKPTAAAARRVGRTTWIAGGIGLAAVVTVGVAVFAGRSDERAPSLTESRSTESHPSTSALPVVDVYKSPTCGCCSKWVDHLREEGFEVRTTDTGDLADFKASHGVPRRLESCHAALAGGYVLEGHVPRADVKRLLQERPAIAGLAVAGMPIGSPGMEVPGTAVQPYEVIAFRKNGETDVFARH